MSRFESNIVVNYEGILADRLVWNREVFGEFAEASKLETKVEIRAGDAVRRNEIDQSGNTLIWKRFGKPADLGSVSPKFGVPGQYVEVTPPVNGRRIMNIQHRIIADDVLENSRGEFDKEKYVGVLDSSVKAGLGLVLAQEKRDLAGGAAQYHASEAVAKSIEVAGTALEIGFLAGLGYMTYSFARGDFTNYLIEAGLLSSSVNRSFARLLEVIVALNNGAGVIMMAREVRPIRNSHYHA